MKVLKVLGEEGVLRNHLADLFEKKLERVEAWRAQNNCLITQVESYLDTWSPARRLPAKRQRDSGRVRSYEALSF